jgi:hypothetical protein
MSVEKEDLATLREPLARKILKNNDAHRAVCKT